MGKLEKAHNYYPVLWEVGLLIKYVLLLKTLPSYYLVRQVRKSLANPVVNRFQ